MCLLGGEKGVKLNLNGYGCNEGGRPVWSDLVKRKRKSGKGIRGSDVIGAGGHFGDSCRCDNPWFWGMGKE
jgi:hypothetical protein